MKKFLIFTAVIMLFLGVAFYHNGLSAGFRNALLTVYDGDKVIETSVGFLNGYDGAQRLELVGSFSDTELLKVYDATELWREEFDDLCVIYAFSPMMKDKVKIKNRTVNLMIALRKDSAIIGTPILRGSY